MTERLTLARFAALADAYGGVVARWPEEHREAAAAMASHGDARNILEDALNLDGALDAWLLVPPSSSLREQVNAGIPMRTGRMMTRARLWWSGVGIAAALAGATAGTAAVAIAAPVDAVFDSSTSFGDVSGLDT
jgi:hypothetical protein